MSLIKLGEAPAPTQYNKRSDFDRSSPTGRSFSFGIAREAYSKVFFKENPPADKSIPGPGSYDLGTVVGREAKRFSIYGRTPNHCTQLFIYLDYSFFHFSIKNYCECYNILVLLTTVR